MKNFLISVFFSLSLLLLLSTAVFAQEITNYKHYQIDLNYDNGNFVFKNIIVSEKEVDLILDKEEKDFSALIYSFDNEILARTYFSAPEENSFVLNLPYFANGEKFKIFDNQDKELLAVNIGIFSKVCGDGICQAHESYENCPADCKSGSADDYCDHIKDGICDPDCQNIKDADEDCLGENPATIQQKIQNEIQELEKDNGQEDSAVSSASKYKNYFIALIFLIICIIVIFMAALSYFKRKE